MSAHPFRETVRQAAVGERRYVRFSEGRGHFAHLQLRLTPTSGTSCAITRAAGLILPEAWYAAARNSVLSRLRSGPLQGFEMYGFQVEFVKAGFLAPYSDPEAFAIVATMAFDEALRGAGPVIMEPWIGVRLRVEKASVQGVLATLARLTGEASVTVSACEYFVLKAELPQRLLSRLTLALGIRDLETFPLVEHRIYRIASGPASSPDAGAALNDWT